MHQLATIINTAFDLRTAFTAQNAPQEYRAAVMETMAGLELGTIRVAEKIAGNWQINEWVKKAVLLCFKLHDNQIISAGDYNFFDKIPVRFANYTPEQLNQLQIRLVPPGVARMGSYLGPNSILMAGYVNIGAYIGSGTMIDIWTTIGSCAQIGNNCHISSNAVIGGVLEPIQANPVIIEDNCFVGACAVVAEGIIVEENSIIATGTKINKSTKIYDRATDSIITGRVPAGSVVVPGSIPAANGKYNIDCAVIVKTVDAQTRAKVSINDLLREHSNVCEQDA